LADQNTTQYTSVTISPKYCSPLAWSQICQQFHHMFRSWLDTTPLPGSRWPILPCTWKVRVLLSMDCIIIMNTLHFRTPSANHYTARNLPLAVTSATADQDIRRYSVLKLTKYVCISSWERTTWNEVGWYINVKIYHKNILGG